jgi:hypothetical protein
VSGGGASCSASIAAASRHAARVAMRIMECAQRAIGAFPVDEKIFLLLLENYFKNIAQNMTFYFTNYGMNAIYT